MAAPLYEPDARYGPYSAIVKDELCVWGGKVKASTSSLQIYHPCLESWRQLYTRGPPPTGLYYGASAHSQHYFYLYGGVKAEGSLTGCLHKLDTNTAVWTALSGHCPGAPMKKTGCGMIVYENSVIIIGGYCIRNGPIQPGSEWKKSRPDDDDDPNTDGWTNEMHKYDLKEGTWSSLACTGTRPPPCSVFSLTMIDHHRAVLFGGVQDGRKCNDAYVLDLATMHWSKIHPAEGGPSPRNRSSHAAVCLDYGGDRPQVVITGGLDDDNKVLNDMWIMDVHSGTWKEIPVPNLQTRLGHCAAAFSLSPGTTEVVLFGGSKAYPAYVYNFISETTVIRLVKDLSNPQAEWTFSDMTDQTHRGTSERIREKMTKLSQLTHEISKVKQQEVVPTQNAESRVVEAERGREEAKRRFQEAERGRKEAERKYQEAERGREEAERRSQEAERGREEAERRSQEAERGREEAERRSQEAERGREEAVRRSQEADRSRGVAERRSQEARSGRKKAEMGRQSAEQGRQEAEEGRERAEKERQKAEHERQEAERERADAEKRRREAENRVQDMERQIREQQNASTESEKNWLVQRREISMTNQRLGEGGWGEVKVAMFREAQVAAKVLYRDLQSPYYHRAFTREMNMASRCRHPNLAQFIGASMDKEMVILMELMPTSLRQYLTSNAPAIPSATFLVSVSLDVAKALNYLHLMQPYPIIHRDVSSANVLLEPLPNKRWRAKVTDYGSVNLQNRLNTKNPGNPVYSAPEAHTPSQQTIKMDTFSFGVLLIEMCTAQFPDEDKKEAMLYSIRERRWADLIQECIQQDQTHRPVMSEIITQLTTWQ